jgi:hypothetical protein
VLLVVGDPGRSTVHRMASPGYRTFGSLGGPDVQSSGPLAAAAKEDG